MTKLFSLKHPSLLALTVSIAGCASLTYEELPSPKQESKLEMTASAKRICELLPQAAASMQMKVDSTLALPAGCAVDLRRDAPWWLPGDDGERLRVRVIASPKSAAAGESSSAAVVEIEAKRVAPGQVWIGSAGKSLMQRLSDLSTSAQ